ncbi:hypothetical protein EGT67_11705 [Prescottella agglutinans]|uniref:Uncharacterized protein n=1 Tax=Prescottella agglutinans TaxID=1644129 RepID=A0A438BF09_9NOCA|nr:hypothetical protein [Prescottella agglutinans]RVW09442.1 hypothetical protein EGT67_11705 [Prescottella agglutinans]
MQTYDYPTDLDDSMNEADDLRVPSERAKRIVLILGSALATISPSGLAFAIGVPLAEIARIFALTTAPVGCAFLLLRPRS